MPVIWEDPPPAPTNSRRGALIAAAAELREHPKRWGRVFTGKKSSATSLSARLNHNKRPGYETGRWVTVARAIGEDIDTEWAVFAPYMGDDEES